MPLSSPLPGLERLLTDSSLIKQGAEARVYKTSLIPTEPRVLLKHRFSKTYRHPVLDQQLTRQRLTFEARALVRAAKAGISVPGLLGVDLLVGSLLIEYIEGCTVRDALLDPVGQAPILDRLGSGINDILDQIGLELAKLHNADLIHGDLTTSNMLIRVPCAIPVTAQIVLIDFGLSFVSSLVEDKAVDLYVLERAFLSTHPDLSTSATLLKQTSERFERVLAAYAINVAAKTWQALMNRLTAVRARGRKRSMLG